MPDKRSRHPPDACEGARGELGKDSLANPAFIGAVETVSFCLLSFRTAAHFLEQQFSTDSGVAKRLGRRRTRARKARGPGMGSCKSARTLHHQSLLVLSVSFPDRVRRRVIMMFLPTDATASHPRHNGSSASD